MALFKRKSISQQYDEELLDLINDLKEDWDYAQKTQAAIADSDIEIEESTQLAKRKYFFIYNEARRRNIKNNRIQSSVIDSVTEIY
ncbi:YaaL family protein [Lentilactobacillus laojiaonis]|uniref:YaaL family protein n=1 Tax=Lentilactobacillus laojiaonis TaxID=2883998 RepID=UPI001D0A83CB|nr:YaaL family protein [Lentilactobacillus laojiaonis]UDM31855.1 YaaL family protein [Lentilactobacillus laojiaonis]